MSCFWNMKMWRLAGVCLVLVVQGLAWHAAGADVVPPGVTQVPVAGRVAAEKQATTESPSSGVAPASAPSSAAESDGIEPVSFTWRGEATVWLWLFGISGDIGLGNATVNVDASFGDVVDASDSIVAFSGRLELGYGRFAGFVDGTYADIGAEDQTGPVGFGEVDVTFEVGVVDFGLMYRLAEWNCPEIQSPRSPRSPRRSGTLDVYVGARYITLNVEFDPALAADRSASRDWIDPIVGLKVTQPVGERLHLAVWGDVGGFGAASDFTWQATVVVGYDFTMFTLPATVYGGYRAIGWDYTDGSGARRFEWDVILHGPTLGLQVRF